jgi:hypothetical protein
MGLVWGYGKDVWRSGNWLFRDGVPKLTWLRATRQSVFRFLVGEWDHQPAARCVHMFVCRAIHPQRTTHFHVAPGIHSPTLLHPMVLTGPPLWSSGRSSWLQIRRPGFDSRHYQKEKKVVGLERGPLSLVSTTEELLDRKVAAPI